MSLWHFSIRSYFLSTFFPYRCFCPTRPFFLLSTLFPVDVCYFSRFCPSRRFYFNILSQSAFFYLKFCPIWRFFLQCLVVRCFLLSEFFTFDVLWWIYEVSAPCSFLRSIQCLESDFTVLSLSLSSAEPNCCIFFFSIFLQHNKIHGLYFLFRYFFCPTKYTFL